MGAAQPNVQQHIKRNEEKWSKPLIEAGWTCIPNVIIQRMAALGLHPVDFTIIAYLASLWWDAHNPPYPSVKAIAEATRVSVRTVQRHMKGLEAGGLIQREKRSDARGQTSNRYHFTKLIAEATPLAHEAIAEKKRRHDEDAARRTRKLRRSLHAVK